MHDILLDIGVAVFILYAVFNIAYIMSMKRLSERMERFLGNIEENLNTTLAGMKGTFENTRKFTADMNAVTADIRQIADAIVYLQRGVRELYQHVQEDMATTAEANLAGLKAGITTGVKTLVRNMQQERSDDHERGTEH